MDYNKEIVEPGDRFSEQARQVCVQSFGNSPAITIHRGGKGMRAMDGFAWNKPVLQAMLAGNIYEVGQSDGAGGKPQFFTLLNDARAFVNLGWEIITMNADDVACRGGLPVMMLSSNIDVKRITNDNWHLCEGLLYGIAKILKKVRMPLLTGETAIMKDSITAFCDTGSDEQLILAWGATCLGLASTNKEPNGTTIRPGMKIIGFQDAGYRCNGGSKITNIILETWGPDIPKIIRSSDAMRFVEKAVVPSRSYAWTIARLNGWNRDGSITTPLANLHGVAHITGGGVWSKLGEILPEGVGANLNSMPDPPAILLEAHRLSQRTESPVTYHDCYGTFHGGCGMMIVCEDKDVAQIVGEAIEDCHTPYLIGETTNSPEGEITIDSRFTYGKTLSSLELGSA